jgi:hypothetical protein
MDKFKVAKKDGEPTRIYGNIPNGTRGIVLHCNKLIFIMKPMTRISLRVSKAPGDPPEPCDAITDIWVVTCPGCKKRISVVNNLNHVSCIASPVPPFTWKDLKKKRRATLEKKVF